MPSAIRWATGTNWDEGGADGAFPLGLPALADYVRDKGVVVKFESGRPLTAARQRATLIA